MCTTFYHNKMCDERCEHDFNHSHLYMHHIIVHLNKIEIEVCMF